MCALSVPTSRMFVLVARSCCSRSATPSAASPRSALRQAFSLDTLTAGPVRTPAGGPWRDERASSSASAQRSLSGLAMPLRRGRRPLLDLGPVEESTRKALACHVHRTHITDPVLARLVVEQLGEDLEDSNAVIFDCNPGPGVLTRTLLNAGAQRVVALENENYFLPELQGLEESLDGQLKVFHCDFFRLDPISQGFPRPGVLYSEQLFSDLGLTEAPWSADIPVRVVGMFPLSKQKNRLWRLIHLLFQRQSIYRFGRIELNVFISEMEYKKIMALPGDMKNYRGLGALWQMACDIQLLHKVPLSSFTRSTQNGESPAKKAGPDEHLCLVRMTPRPDFFNATLTPANAPTLVLMVKQCLAKRKAVLAKLLDSWNPEVGSQLLLNMGMLDDILTGQLYPDEYKQLFELMEQSQHFSQSWLYGEAQQTRRGL